MRCCHKNKRRYGFTRIQKAATGVSRLCLFDWIPLFSGMTITDSLDCSRMLA